MLTGRDCFGTQVALRHKGGLREDVPTLAETSSVRKAMTPPVSALAVTPSRGFDTYLNFPGWGSWNEGTQPQSAESQRSRHA